MLQFYKKNETAPTKDDISYTNNTTPSTSILKEKMKQIQTKPLQA